MKIQTFSCVVGSSACNAKCPFCVAKMTPKCDVNNEVINWRNFDIGCRFAMNSGVSTVLLTGKGEPTLFPNLITDYLNILNGRFPFIELQTNGSTILDDCKWYQNGFRKWYDRGLTTVALSVVNYDPIRNNEVYGFKTPLDIEKSITKLHEIGFSVRLTCMLLKGQIDSVKEMTKLIEFAKANKVEQVTVRSICKPEATQNKKIAAWIDENRLDDSQIDIIKNVVLKNLGGVKLMELIHGATVYDMAGQNICFSNCLTRTPDEKESIRQLIFIANHLRYDWVYEGAILL